MSKVPPPSASTTHVLIKIRNLQADGLRKTTSANKKQGEKNTAVSPARRSAPTFPRPSEASAPALTLARKVFPQEELTSTRLHFCPCPWVHLTPTAKPWKTRNGRTDGWETTLRLVGPGSELGHRRTLAGNAHAPSLL